MSDNISNIIQNHNQNQNQIQEPIQTYEGRKITILKDVSNDITYFQYDKDEIEEESCQLNSKHQKQWCSYNYEISEDDFNIIISLLDEMNVQPGESMYVRGDQLSYYIKIKYGAFIGLGS